MFDKAPELYDLFYEWKDYRAEAEQIRELVRARRPGSTTLLDVACGTGAHLIHLREWFEIAGLDIDPGLLSVAREKLPEVPLQRADMRDFDLGRQFDVVTCLFSSIGYMQTVADLQLAVQTMARHLLPGGLLIVEPWFSPETFDPNHLGRTILVKRQNLEAVRMNGSRVDGRRSTLDLHYLVATPGKVEYLSKKHVLGLFTDDEYRQAFELAGLVADHDPEGLMGRGLWVGRRTSAEELPVPDDALNRLGVPL
jgi:ubiquinone/menaquinone biosynthesis C-methylase UbiE